MDPSPSVLLVDDNRVNQFLGKRILNNLGITNIILAGNGNEAFQLLSSNKVDFLLTDVEMPEMNGYELSKALRDTPGFEKLIIIALTANGGEDDREKAREAGIDDYVVKPYTPQDLLEVLQKYLSEKETHYLEDVITAPVQNRQAGMHQVYHTFNNNTSDIRQFLYLISGQFPTLVNNIKTGIIEGDWDLAFHAAHKMKSPVSLLGDAELYERVSAFTEVLRERSNLENSASLFEDLAPALESLLVLVNQELESLG